MARDFIPAVLVPNEIRFRGWAPSSANLINCMPLIINGDEVTATIRPEFQFGSHAAAASTDRGRGLTYFDDSSITVDDTTYYYNGGNQDMTATTGNGYAANTGFNEDYLASFSTMVLSNVVNLVIVNAGHTSTHASANHGNIWYVADSTSAPGSVSDADLICNDATTPVSIIRGGASLDGYFFVGDIYGRIYNSNLNSITAWTSGDFLTAEMAADVGIYIGRHHNNIVYIGTESIEFFYNAGNASGSPLSVRKDIAYDVGVVFPNAIVERGDVMYFVGADRSGALSVYKLVNFQLSKIGTPKIEYELGQNTNRVQNLTNLDSLRTQVWLSDIRLYGSDGLVLTMASGNSDATFYYHELTGVWAEWNYGTTVTYNGGAGDWTDLLPIVSSNRARDAIPGGEADVQFINGEVAFLTNAADNDAINDLNGSNAAVPYIIFPEWDAGTDKKKRINNVRVVTSPIATDSAANTSLNATLRWIDLENEADSTAAFPDQYTTARTVDLNTRGRRVYRCGKTRSRRHLLTIPVGHGPVTAIKGLEIDYDIVE